MPDTGAAPDERAMCVTMTRDLIRELAGEEAERELRASIGKIMRNSLDEGCSRESVLEMGAQIFDAIMGDEDQQGLDGLRPGQTDPLHYYLTDCLEGSDA